MEIINSFIESSVWIAWIVMAISFYVLAKCADLFVDSSVSIANKLSVPKIVVGIVLVSLATTAPELSVSLMSAVRGNPEMALGNAVGSVICNTGLALGLCALISAAAVPVIPHVLKSSGGFLVLVSLLAFGFVAFDLALSRWEGAILVVLFVGYMCYMVVQHKKGRFHDDVDLEAAEDHLHVSLTRLFVLLALALGGIIFASHFVITSALTIARAAHIPEAVIALTLVALGTSIPEVATCVAAARKKEGAIAVGNILGANIINICWVAGASAMVNKLSLSQREVFFMFPAMFAIMLTSLFMLRTGYKLTKRQGVILFTLYILYLASFFVMFPPV